MNTINYDKLIKLYLANNSRLSYEDIGILIYLDSIYSEIPDDLKEFREVYPHFDPDIIEKKVSGITFLQFAEGNENQKTIKQKVNSYINIKFNDVESKKSYKENMIRFKNYSIKASKMIEDILKMSMLPESIRKILREDQRIKNCYDFCNLLKIYKNSQNKRIKFEILRKIGLIVLIARINRSFNLPELFDQEKSIMKAFKKGLILKEKKTMIYYFWIDHVNKIQYTTIKEEAIKRHRLSTKERKKLCMQTFPIQSIKCKSQLTKSNIHVIDLRIRNKFNIDGEISYASFIEKELRKNLHFPNQIHDVIGVKIILENEEDIEKLIHDIEYFLGGSSTRTGEKNTYHKFGKKKLGEFSSKEYFVWKAVYDITLPRLTTKNTEKILQICKGNKIIIEALNKRKKFLADNPHDFIIELQLQDLNSYLLSLAKGSSTEHALLKMNQIRSNSLYKIFPKIIYEKYIEKAKLEILNRSTTSAYFKRISKLISD